jgi:hypothetical protein
MASPHNAPAIKLVTDRYSAHVQSFNHLPVSEDDSDTHYWLSKELETLATRALSRAPLFKPSGNRVALLPSTDLGNVRIAMRRAFTPEELARYNKIQDDLTALTDKYEG